MDQNTLPCCYDSYESAKENKKYAGAILDPFNITFFSKTCQNLFFIGLF